MHSIPMRLWMLCLVLGCFALSSAPALELGDITVSSEVGQILDAEIALRDVARENLTDWYVLPVVMDDYQAPGLEYINGLHDRLVIEIVTSASPPYIAISSLASIGQRSFDLIVRIGDGNKTLSNIYQVTLKKPSPPPPEIVKAMTAAEMLNYLVNKLAAAQNISATKTWGALQALITTTEQGGAYKFSSYLSSVNVDARFSTGIRAMLSEYQKTVFDRVRAESGDARAVGAVLFGQQDFLILKTLFSNATTHSLPAGKTKSKQLEFERERVAILQNKLFALEHSKMQQDMVAQRKQVAPPKSGQDKNNRWWDYKTWLSYLEWGEKPLLSNAKVWMLVAIIIILGFLLLLLSRRLLRTPKAPVVNRKRVTAPLPGQIELQNLRAPQLHINPPTNDAEAQSDDATSKLNQAEAYIAMGENAHANSLLAEVEQHSKDPEQLERMRSLRSKMKE